MKNKIKVIVSAVATILIALFPAYQETVNAVSEEVVVAVPAVLSIIATVTALLSDKPGKKNV